MYEEQKENKTDVKKDGGVTNMFSMETLVSKIDP